ncbi:similar to Saccharomyces cerevisiae YDR481C PHO8 Repressible vacuolar alkaline phosphatase [Maudiozyma barnettii]|uniref:Alkaline phosphatase n=1 Tax=Maudiozyma barnettii TaxID=61262 RepID=A0A8H2VGY5_9SACH|nr:alkaline phosphatase PHO8 [Kazachstania barnettii]CAB4255058.1 similar to Saccharomyces cerevisiae YDR481C PHO8 Repressible vacuolar alkaline phosphatase [Kazachstania barnettii]CAD1783329.1 similar to Saccharomyces cerevisiae YDR481C PHO8 Repressible vacuolar alkaline phosphatase [Kazachstania barnettii]
MSESTALLGKRFRTNHILRNKKLHKVLLAILTVVLITLYSYFEPFPTSFGHPKPQKKNLIFFVTDGMGPASLSLTRSFRQLTEGLPINDILELDHHLIGSSRTRSSDSLITDSAAGATAFSCALKSYNGAIGVSPLKNPCGTILEAAKLKGYMTGLVVTTRITDATPAAFSSHADYRVQEDLIALHQLGEYPLGRMVDLIIGGGRSHYTSKVRKDGRDLLHESVENGWQLVQNRKEFDSLQLGDNVTLPLLALIAENDVPFDIDRDPKMYPSLEEQALTAIKALTEATKDSDEGFFLLIEGSRIDHAGHQNDPAAQVREVLAFDKAFKSVLEFAEQSDVETVLISTSDHETGGLVTARQVTESYPDYVWFPQVLANSTHSGEHLKSLINNFKGKKEEKTEFVKHEIMENHLGINDYTEHEIKSLVSETDANKIQDLINIMVSFRAQVGWTTHGHSAVDVNIYAYSNRRERWHDILDHLQGNHENIEIGEYMAKYLNLDLNSITELVKDTHHSPDAKVALFETEHDIYGHKLN